MTAEAKGGNMILIEGEDYELQDGEAPPLTEDGYRRMARRTPPARTP
jgi:hypothetical protein